MSADHAETTQAAVNKRDLITTMLLYRGVQMAQAGIAGAARFGTDLPVIVLTAGNNGLGGAGMWNLWQNELQPELVKRSSRGYQHIVQGATHLIPMEKPQAVVEAIREMLSNIRTPASSSRGSVLDAATDPKSNEAGRAPNGIQQP